LLEHELVNQYRHPTLAKIQGEAAANLAHHSDWANVYLIIHGLAKVILIAAIFMHRRWAYVALIWVLVVFAVLEMFKGAFDASWLAILFGLFDLILAFLIWKEYKQLPGKKAQGP